MSEFLYDELEGYFVEKTIKNYKKYPCVEDNLNKKIELRDYQKEAFNRFYLYYEDKEKFFNKHLCFNMATGSGKTIIMAGLVLYLYSKGYRNFLFFVNRNQIIEKTKDNFINSSSSKYLFNDSIVIDNKNVDIKLVDNFSYSSGDSINITFSSIQKLFNDINDSKENSLSLDDFENKKIVLLSDEAHHLNSSTKSKQSSLDGELEEKESWENTVEKIFKVSNENLLLEFSATIELDKEKIEDKYKDKIIFKYDLESFCKDKYSKHIELFKTDTGLKDMMLQAIVISMYKEDIAIKYNMSIKPVILFKSDKISSSTENQKIFKELIENLKDDDIKIIKGNTNIDLLKKACEVHNLLDKIKITFDDTRILCTNGDRDLEKNQILLNSLEDRNNIIRAIFTVDKLNEGWDVLNLFDIVRLRDKEGNEKNKKTIKDAQLIGRGARYCPFLLDGNDSYKRKFDEDLKDERVVLETLHYHSKNDSAYIKELKETMKGLGLTTSDEEKKVKLSIKKGNKKIRTLLNTKYIFLNEKKKKDNKNIKNIRDFGIKTKNFEYRLSSGEGYISEVFKDDEVDNSNKKSKILGLRDFHKHIVLNSIYNNSFFTFKNLKNYFPNLKSISEFINSDSYLKSFEIKVLGEIKNNEDRLNIINSFLLTFKDEILNNVCEFEGEKDFRAKKLNEIFKDIEMISDKKVSINNDDWYIYEQFIGTDQEGKLIDSIRSLKDVLDAKYKDNFYLLRSERAFKIYNFEDGRAFEPDFFFIASKSKINYCLFIEAKGKHLEDKDRWKEEFLQELSKKYGNSEILKEEYEDYKLFGLDFYNEERENKFIKQFKDNLEITN